MKLTSFTHANVLPDGTFPDRCGCINTAGAVQVSILQKIVIHTEPRTESGRVRINTYYFADIVSFEAFLEKHLTIENLSDGK
jgi:hypothetical protein